VCDECGKLPAKFLIYKGWPLGCGTEGPPFEPGRRRQARLWIRCAKRCSKYLIFKGQSRDGGPGGPPFEPEWRPPIGRSAGVCSVKGNAR
jgi:hypothetical protein